MGKRIFPLYVSENQFVVSIPIFYQESAVCSSKNAIYIPLHIILHAPLNRIKLTKTLPDHS